ncbi:hypothetical protein [Streptomyces boninensis]|uniref:hypothetical protein n=1 Tax=Streptomyces boninensis TaxID=2039455 RepID=UPI003B21D19D
MAKSTGREISVRYQSLPPELTGFCAQLSGRSVIVVSTDASPLNRILICCHELVHIWRGHTPTDGGLMDTAMLQRLLPGIDPAVARTVLMRRSHYQPKQEREAEVLATQLVSCMDLRSERTDDRALRSALTHRRWGV